MTDSQLSESSKIKSSDYTRLRQLCMILIFTLIASGMTLAVIAQIQSYHRQQIYIATEASLPRHNPEPIFRQALGIWSDYRGNGSTTPSFSYPAKMSLIDEGGKITLSHEIPFKNFGECDMKGDDKTYDYLKDFGLSMQVVGGNLAQAARKFSPYIPEENFVGNGLKENPGFIDTFQAGKWRGFTIYEGAEGCGHTIYYLPVDSGRTFVVTKDMVQLLSGVVSSDMAKQVLQAPGVITREESDEIFREILESASFN